MLTLMRSLHIPSSIKLWLAFSCRDKCLLLVHASFCITESITDVTSSVSTSPDTLGLPKLWVWPVCLCPCPPSPAPGAGKGLMPCVLLPRPYYSLGVDIFAITFVLVGVPPQARTLEQVVYLRGDPGSR